MSGVYLILFLPAAPAHRGLAGAAADARCMCSTCLSLPKGSLSAQPEQPVEWDRCLCYRHVAVVAATSSSVKIPNSRNILWG